MLSITSTYYVRCPVQFVLHPMCQNEKHVLHEHSALFFRHFMKIWNFVTFVYFFKKNHTHLLKLKDFDLVHSNFHILSISHSLLNLQFFCTFCSTFRSFLIFMKFFPFFTSYAKKLDSICKCLVYLTLQSTFYALLLTLYLRDFLWNHPLLTFTNICSKIN